MLEYKGYYGSAHYSEEDEVFWGKLEFIRHTVSFESDTAKGLRRAFEEAVDDYLETCKAEGIKPSTPFRGVFNVRTSPELHRRAALYAEEHGMKLNTLVNEALKQYVLTPRPK
jgi:predicted HicB family RNase H-like nuclease